MTCRHCPRRLADPSRLPQSADAANGSVADAGPAHALTKYGAPPSQPSGLLGQHAVSGYRANPAAWRTMSFGDEADTTVDGQRTVAHGQDTSICVARRRSFVGRVRVIPRPGPTFR